ncbi:hypothetical protein BG004_005347 [Podila humilis]|nr:hypothetical protein BG004_005347 [Podila humilis]
MENSAKQLAVFVEKAATGVNKVDLVGHSEGSLMPQYYLKYFDGGSKVAKFAAFGTLVHGTTLLSLVPLFTGF